MNSVLQTVNQSQSNVEDPPGEELDPICKSQRIDNAVCADCSKIGLIAKAHNTARC
jgi:hypothetical protein